MPKCMEQKKEIDYSKKSSENGCSLHLQSNCIHVDKPHLKNKKYLK